MPSGYPVTVYRETQDGSGYRKIQEYGEEKGVSLGILWKKTRVYEVVWGHEEAVKRSTAREGDREGLCRGAQERVSVGSEGGHSVASSKSRPSTCVVGSVGSVEGNEVEEQRKAAWAWKRREEASEGAREKTGDGLLKEHMYGKDFNSMWEVLCLLEGRPNSEEELQKIRQGVPTRVESRHNLGAMEESLPSGAVSWQRYIKRTRQGRRMGGPLEVEARTAEGGYNVAVYRESGERYRKWVEYGDGTPLDAGFLCTKGQAYTILWGVRSTRSDTAEVAAAVQGGLDNAQDREEWPEEMPDRARHRSYQGMASASIGHSARLTRLAGSQWGTRCAKHSRKGIWRGPQSRGGHGESCGTQECGRGSGYLDEVRRGEIWGGACEFGRWA